MKNLFCETPVRRLIITRALLRASDTHPPLACPVQRDTLLHIPMYRVSTLRGRCSVRRELK